MKRTRYVLFFLCVVSFFSHTLFASAHFIQIIDSQSQHKDEIVSAILELQKSLVLPLEETELPTFAQNGFLTIQMTPEYLYDFIATDKILVAYCDEEIVGYLLLGSMEGYISWARGKRFDSKWNLNAIADAQYIDQIAVAIPFARQGIGTTLIEQAKILSPRGLVTDILLAPYSNTASIAFFTKKTFTDIGTMHIEANAKLPAHKTIVMYWSGL